MIPIVDGLEQQYTEQTVIKRINADVGGGPTIMKDYRIPGHPAILIFNNAGQEVQRFIGPQSIKILEEALQETLDTT